MSPPRVLTGGCQCGHLRWCATGAPTACTVCHCENCRRAFCPRCGSRLTYVGARRPDEVDVTAGTADAPEAYPPTADNFPEDRSRWVAPVAGHQDPQEAP